MMKKPMMKKGMAYKKSMAYKMKTNQDGGSYTAKNPGAAAGQLKKDQSVATKYGSPTHKVIKELLKTTLEMQKLMVILQLVDTKLKKPLRLLL